MKHGVRTAVLAALAALAAASVPSAPGGVDVSYLYRLSNFSGTVPYSEVQLWVDRGHDEVYIAQGDVVRLYNAAGMEIYEFQHDVRLGTILGLAVDEAGDILILSHTPGGPDEAPGGAITRCDYRGAPRAVLALSNLPDAFSRFAPNVLVYQAGRLVLASTTQMLVGSFDLNGAFERGWDLAEILGISAADRAGLELGGFATDRRGNFVFTIPADFKAYVVSPEGEVAAFGGAGSTPGRFGVAAGIAADERGNLLVADRLRNVVMVFDEGFRLLQEFGFRNGTPESLVRPGGLAVGNGGKVYVSQLGNRGVSVFAVTPR